jgi:hypothetical protein
MAKAALNKKTLFTSKLDLNLRKKQLVKCYIWSIVLYCVENWTLRKVDQNYLERFEMWCWRRMEKIIWTNRVRNEVLQTVKEDRNILHTIKRRKANWIGHILRGNCHSKTCYWRKEGVLEVTRRRWRSRKQLLGDLKEIIGYWKLKDEALDRTLWRTRFGKGYGPVVRQTKEWMNESLLNTLSVQMRLYDRSHKSVSVLFSFLLWRILTITNLNLQKAEETLSMFWYLLHNL